jgi:hypothetical protein
MPPSIDSTPEQQHPEQDYLLMIDFGNPGTNIREKTRQTVLASLKSVSMCDGSIPHPVSTAVGSARSSTADDEVTVF